MLRECELNPYLEQAAC